MTAADAAKAAVQPPRGDAMIRQRVLRTHSIPQAEAVAVRRIDGRLNDSR
jgi:hypothetical protein